jgi:hypothetical protein
MTQPPEEPPERRPEESWPDESGPAESWQAPGPAPQPPPPVPPYVQNPYGQPPPNNPYGGGTTDFYRPIDSGGMSAAAKIVLGVVLGVFAGFFLWFVAAVGFAASTPDGNTFLFFAAVAPLVVPAPLLIWKATRPWAVGLLMGTALASIGLSSLCSAMISSFEGGA